MNEDFVTFEISKKVKEKGFPLVDYIPTISQVLKWLREEKKMHICVSYSDNIGAMWEYEVILLEGALYQNAGSAYVSYEQAALAGIEYVLNLI